MQLQHGILERDRCGPGLGRLLVGNLHPGLDSRRLLVGGHHLGPSDDLGFAGGHRGGQLHVQPIGRRPGFGTDGGAARAHCAHLGPHAVGRVFLAGRLPGAAWRGRRAAAAQFDTPADAELLGEVAVRIDDARLDLHLPHRNVQARDHVLDVRQIGGGVGEQ